jgi:hypothetical protein
MYSLTDSCVLSTLPHSSCISQQIYVFTLLHSRDNNCRWPYSLFTLLHSIRYICFQVHVFSRCTLLRSRCTISWYLLALFFNADIAASKFLHSFFTLLNDHKRSNKKNSVSTWNWADRPLYSLFTRLLGNIYQNYTDSCVHSSLFQKSQQKYQPTDSCVYSSLFYTAVLSASRQPCLLFTLYAYTVAEILANWPLQALFNSPTYPTDSYVYSPLSYTAGLLTLPLFLICRQLHYSLCIASSPGLSTIGHL